eukprot:3890066-Rhodomonas_salina.1
MVGPRRPPPAVLAAARFAGCRSTTEPDSGVGARPNCDGEAQTTTGVSMRVSRGTACVPCEALPRWRQLRGGRYGISASPPAGDPVWSMLSRVRTMPRESQDADMGRGLMKGLGNSAVR